MKIKVIILMTLFFLALSCAKKDKNETTDTMVVDSTEVVVNDDHNAKNSLDYIGVYEGILPCADCEGIETSLLLEDHKNYVLKTSYLGKKDVASTEIRGVYSWNNEGNTIVLSGIENGPSHYFVGENYIAQLDLKGNKISGKLADTYILQKQEIIGDSVEEIPKPAKENLNKINSPLNQSEMATNLSFSLRETKWKLVELNGKPVKNITKSNKDMFLQLNKDNRYAAFAGCNNMMGSFELNEGLMRLKFSKGASTMMACPDMSSEQEFSDILEKVDNYSLNGNKLSLNKARMAPVARFEAIHNN